MFDIVLNIFCCIRSYIFKYILFLFAILFRFLGKYRCIQTMKIKLLQLSRKDISSYSQVHLVIKYKGESFVLSPPEDLSRPSLCRPCALPSARLDGVSKLLESHYWPPRGTAGLAQSPHFITSIDWLKAALGDSREHLALGQPGAVHPVGGTENSAFLLLCSAVNSTMQALCTVRCKHSSQQLL